MLNFAMHISTLEITARGALYYLHACAEVYREKYARRAAVINENKQ